MRLIDADALMEHIKDLPTWWADGGGYYPGAMKYPDGMFDPEDIISSIANAPAVEAMPLPCKLGDSVYIIVNLKSGNPSHIVERKCTGIHITEKVFRHRAEKAHRYLVTNSDIGFAEHIPFAKIGELVFFTRKEAEAALAERMTSNGE